MKVKNVLIRKSTGVDMLDGKIKTAFKDLTQKTQIPVYYQELQNTTERKLIDDKNLMIGVASNVRFNEEGDLVCTVVTIDTLALTQNFQNVIDNFLIEAPINGRPTVKQFVIYDAEKKREIDERRKNIVPKVGVFPESSDIPKEVVDSAIKSLAAEFKKEVQNGSEEPTSGNVVGN